MTQEVIMPEITSDELIERVTTDRKCPRDETLLQCTDTSSMNRYRDVRGEWQDGEVSVYFKCPMCGATFNETYPFGPGGQTE